LHDGAHLFLTKEVEDTAGKKILPVVVRGEGDISRGTQILVHHRGQEMAWIWPGLVGGVTLDGCLHPGRSDDGPAVCQSRHHLRQKNVHIEGGVTLVESRPVLCHTSRAIP